MRMMRESDEVDEDMETSESGVTDMRRNLYVRPTLHTPF